MPVPPDLPSDFFATRMGVYYPNHHAVLAIDDGEDAARLREELLRSGFAADALFDASPATMAAFLRRTSDEAGLLAQVVASELKQMEILLQLAESGCRFLIVRLDDDAQKEQLMRVGAGYPIEKALHYQALAIEELSIGDATIPGESPYGINETPRDV